MRVHLNRTSVHRRDDGAVAVLVALLMPLLLVMAAAAVDVSDAWATKRNLSVAADAAALAAAGRIGEVAPGGTDCLSKLSADVTAAATSAAQAANQGTAPGSSITVDPPTCVDNGTAIEVHVSNSKQVESFFLSALKLFGANPQPLQPARQATARLTPATTISGLRPFAVCLSVVDSAEAHPDQTFVADLNNKIGICGTTKPGNWGTVDFNGGANGANDLYDWTLNGYPGAVNIPDKNLPADPGMPGPGKIDGPLDTLLNQVILLPVVTQYTETNGNGGGNNASFNTVAFVGARVCGYSLNNKIGKGTCWDNAKAQQYLNEKVDFLQFRYFSYSTSSYPGATGTCKFGSVCDEGVTGVSLYK
jgi:hypothetical protein